MDEQRKIYRIFQLIARLRAPLGCAKSELAENFGVNVRTIERYFKLLRNLGFEIIRVNGRFKIEKYDTGAVKPEDLIVFTLEEAAIIKNSLLCNDVKDPLRKSLLDKLYALTDLEELTDTLFKFNVSKNISDIRFAIKHKYRVILKGYQSLNSDKVIDRSVEPIRFHNYFRYLLAWDEVSQKVKQYKTERITAVELTTVPVRNQDKYGETHIDIFGMSGEKPIPVKLYLSNRARLLMEEEYPGAATFLTLKKGHDYFEGEVYSLEGVGRYVLGLIDEIEVSAPKELKEYVIAKLRKANLV